MEKINELNYKNMPETAIALQDAYLAISEGLFLLSNLYRNAHLNHDGNTAIDGFLENWMEETNKQSFELLHRVRVVDVENRIHPFFGIKKLEFVSPIQEILGSFVFSNDENSLLCQDAFSIIEFLSLIESEFLQMCMELNDALISTYDPVGTDRLANVMEVSELRLLDMNGILRGLE